MNVHLLTICGLLHTIFIYGLLNLSPQLSVFIDLSLSLSLLLIKFYLHLLHLIVEIRSKPLSLLPFFFQHLLVLQVQLTILV